MNKKVLEYFSEYSNKVKEGNFFRVINLNRSVDVSWETLAFNIPNLPRGWYELSLLNSDDRIQFTMEYWLSKLPYQPEIDDKLAEFFSSLEDIYIFATKKRMSDFFEAHMVYSLADDSGFYRALRPAEEEEVIYLQKLFPEYILPDDYLAFLRIHDGFCLAEDNVGIISTKMMESVYREVSQFMQDRIPIRTTKGKLVDYRALIPFYQAPSRAFYQCFWAEWHPGQEIGNLAIRPKEEKSLTDPDEMSKMVAEKEAFFTFSDWLIFYLEQLK